MLKKQDFINKLSEKGYTKKDAATILEDVIMTIEEILVGGDSVNFHGFGTFEVVEREERNIHDYQTKTNRTIPAHKSPKFTAGKYLKRIIKEGYIR